MNNTSYFSFFSTWERMPKGRERSIFAGLILITLFLMMTACDNEITPLTDSANTAWINFYNASEVLNTDYALRTDNLVFINDTVPNGAFNRFPYFSLLGSDRRQYPASMVQNTGQVDDIIFKSNEYDAVYWLPVAPGEYRTIYTSVNRLLLKDTTLSLSGTSHTTQYLVESPEADTAYRIITVPEDQKREQGKVRVRFVHLAWDTEPLKIFRDRQGNRDYSGLPQDISFGNYSAYATLDTTGIALTKAIVLKFHTGEDSNTLLLSVKIPANLGASFVVLIQGVRQERQRRIVSGTLADGILQYKTVNVKPNLRINMRRIN